MLPFVHQLLILALPLQICVNLFFLFAVYIGALFSLLKGIFPPSHSKKAAKPLCSLPQGLWIASWKADVARGQSHPIFVLFCLGCLDHCGGKTTSPAVYGKRVRSFGRHREAEAEMTLSSNSLRQKEERDPGDFQTVAQVIPVHSMLD